MNQPLKQRIGTKYHMQGLKGEELDDYIISRLKLAGAMDTNIFTSGSLDAVYTLTKGIPRMVNKLATASLIAACAKKTDTVEDEIIYQAHQETDI